MASWGLHEGTALAVFIPVVIFILVAVLDPVLVGFTDSIVMAGGVGLDPVGDDPIRSVFILAACASKSATSWSWDKCHPPSFC
jgi:hypothetical protein